MQTYTYRVLRGGGKPESVEAQLNKLGADGWMIIHADEALIILGKSTVSPSPQESEEKK